MWCEVEFGFVCVFTDNLLDCSCGHVAVRFSSGEQVRVLLVLLPADVPSLKHLSGGAV